MKKLPKSKRGKYVRLLQEKENLSYKEANKEATRRLKSLKAYGEKVNPVDKPYKSKFKVAEPSDAASSSSTTKKVFKTTPTTPYGLFVRNIQIEQNLSYNEARKIAKSSYIKPVKAKKVVDPNKIAYYTSLAKMKKNNTSSGTSTGVKIGTKKLPLTAFQKDEIQYNKDVASGKYVP